MRHYLALIFVAFGLIKAFRLPESAVLEDNDNEEVPNLEYGDLLEGDIMTLRDRVACAPCTKWTDNTIPYVIDERAYDQTQLDKIQAGIDDLVSSVGASCLSIIPRSTEDNYVLVGKYGGCSSFLGMIGGVQTMSLEDSCVDRHGTIMHEFLHAIGIHHEHKRNDRDNYVYINFTNIEEGKENNFDKLEPDEEDTFNLSYDYGSVMHYGETAFAIDDNYPTIIPYNDTEIGQRLELSDRDIQTARNWLGCV